MQRVLVLGSGVIGVATAWYLSRAGFEVTVVDREAGPARATSFANAGQISPGYASPWAAPGVPLKALKLRSDPGRPRGRLGPRHKLRHHRADLAGLRLPLGRLRRAAEGAEVAVPEARPAGDQADPRAGPVPVAGADAAQLHGRPLRG